MKKRIIGKVVASIIVLGLLALYFLEFISVKVFLPLIVVAFLVFWWLEPKNNKN